MLNRKLKLMELKDIHIPEESLKKIVSFKKLKPESWRTVDTLKLIRTLIDGVWETGLFWLNSYVKIVLGTLKLIFIQAILMKK